MQLIKRMLTSAALTAVLALPFTAVAQTPAPAADKTAKAPKAKATKAPPPTDAEIADARSKGLVWVNTSTKVYHKDGEYYGKTKSGKFMTAADADKAGYRAAKEPSAKKKSSAMPAAPATPAKK
jgi:hypothetical protein